MNKLLKFILVFLGIVALSVFLTPILHSFLGSFFKFEKIFNRLVMIFAIAAAVLFILIPKIKARKNFLDRNTWREYGFDFNRGWKRLFLLGFLTGAIFVATLAFIEVVFGPRYPRSPIELQDVIERWFKGMTSGLIVGIIEEFFFRGFVYTQLRKKMNVIIAVLIASFFYSMCHFFDNGQIFIPENPGIMDCIRLMIGYLEPWTRPQAMMGEFVGLFLFGIVLNLAFVRTKSLFLSIGIHAGAVFAIKWQNSFVRAGVDIEHAYYAKNPYYDGTLEWLMMALLVVVVYFLTRHSFFRSVDSASKA